MFFAKPNSVFLKMKKLHHNGSDHFLCLVILSISNHYKIVSKKPTADAEELDEAKKKVSQIV